MQAVLALASDLVIAAEDDGIEIGHVSLISGLGVSIYAEDDALAPALAVCLGLTARTVRVHSAKDETSVEFFRATIGDVEVATHHVLPTSALAEVAA